MRWLRILALTAVLFCGAAQAGEVWDSLWRNADQRGEQLLQRGDAAAAARTYSEPRRKAFAELQAGDNAAAARDFAAFDDSDGHYNRGNALTRSGDLQEALKAYDAALAHDPKNGDAQHNRDLVAKALRDQQQQQKSPQSRQSKKDQGDSKSPGKDPPSQDSQPANSAGDQGPRPPSDPKQDASAPPPGKSAADPGDSQKKPPESDAAQQQAKTESQQQQARNEAPGEPKTQDSSDPSKTMTVDKDEAEQAKRDARDALQRGAGRTDGTADAPPQKPMTEQQLAQEQWLRQIPDDPGGLLRRKFMIEHMMRQKQQPEPSSVR